ncbi:hypothetical protein Tco_0392836 [Tanacetum coccineum]
MKFMLTAFNVYYVLDEQQIGILIEEEQRKCDQDETLCRGYILSTLTNRLYDPYTPMNSAREIWNSFQEKYTAEKEGADKFITFKLFEFTMEDNVSILDQVHEFLILELHMASVTTTIDEWWYDSSATTHVCNNKDLFKTHKETKDEHEVMMGDNHTLKNLDSNVIVESRDIDFIKDKFCHDSTSTNEIMIQIPQDISGPNLNSNNKRNMVEYSGASRRSKRAKKERNLDPNFIDSQAIIFFVEGDNENNVINEILVLLNVEDAPKIYKEVITSRNSAFWKEAIDDEMNSLISNNTWELSDLPLDKFQHLNIEEANTPYESSCKLVENNERVFAQIEYASAIGCLMYATYCTRPDIAYVVCKLSRYTSNLSQGHWKAIGRIFSYLKRTRQLALYYDRFPAVLEGYSYASWITSSSESKSTIGWIFILGGGCLLGTQRKQTRITHSTMEAEFLALARGQGAGLAKNHCC